MPRPHLLASRGPSAQRRPPDTTRFRIKRPSAGRVLDPAASRVVRTVRRRYGWRRRRGRGDLPPAAVAPPWFPALLRAGGPYAPAATGPPDERNPVRGRPATPAVAARRPGSVVLSKPHQRAGSAGSRQIGGGWALGVRALGVRAGAASRKRLRSTGSHTPGGAFRRLAQTCVTVQITSALPDEALAPRAEFGAYGRQWPP